MKIKTPKYILLHMCAHMEKSKIANEKKEIWAKLGKRENLHHFYTVLSIVYSSRLGSVIQLTW